MNKTSFISFFVQILYEQNKKTEKIIAWHCNIFFIIQG